ncbi:arginine metabolism regulation protein iii [Talaromyces proteolyticus]|uniref:Kinase n=1 Tax=Talaromyces proteolyticus TaxID=1131652 RepID=A0AAD4L723_9EURO|nr:arginine metabolism regulation protein iii [Talaromyces proteolyticus]KAH8705154.1 arginine metabolism regulation protein iii [Talaromyces proteolyticus]
MPSSSRSDSFKGQSLDSESFPNTFDHAAAGHDGLRCHLSGSLIAKPCTAGEVAFYESSVYHSNIQAFMPQWYGTLTSTDQQQPLSMVADIQHQGRIMLPPLTASLPTNIPNGPLHKPTPSQEIPWTPSGGRKLNTGISIVLENIAEGFKRPNVLDVKLGARLWADDAPPAKRTKLDAVSKETTSSSLGFRIAGMKVWVGNDESSAGNTDPEFTDPYMTKYEGSAAQHGQVVEINGYKRYDKWYGRSFTAENVTEGFKTFLAGAKAGRVDRSKLIASRVAEELRALKYALESEESRMYSSSVLVIYEGDPDALEEALEFEKKRKEEEEANPRADSPESETSQASKEIDISELGTLQPLNLQLGEGANVQQALNIQLDPQSLSEIGAQDGDDEEEDEEEPIKVHDFRLIDFAHANWTPGHGPDQNSLMGIRSLIKIMEDLAEEKSEADGKA